MGTAYSCDPLPHLPSAFSPSCVMNTVPVIPLQWTSNVIVSQAHRTQAQSIKITCASCLSAAAFLAVNDCLAADAVDVGAIIPLFFSESHCAVDRQIPREFGDAPGILSDRNLYSNFDFITQVGICEVQSVVHLQRYQCVERSLLCSGGITTRNCSSAGGFVRGVADGVSHHVQPAHFDGTEE